MTVKFPVLLAAALALGGCPRVIRDAPLAPPPPGCEPGSTSCHGGAPWRCGPGGVWSRANRVCGLLSADGGTFVCCATPSPVRPGVMIHACVSAASCDADGGAR